MRREHPIAFEAEASRHDDHNQTLVDPGLVGIPETMLWPLHNRSAEAARPDGILADPDAVRIRARIRYDFEGSFGRAEPSHAIRSLAMDVLVRSFLERHPTGIVVNLGEGLETQRFRVERRGSTWFTIDLPEALAVREIFIQPDQHHIHVAASALDETWMDRIPSGMPTLFTAQGLLMYFESEQVAKLIRDIGARFPGAEMAFDTIPRWFSRKTMRGLRIAPAYTAPPMPWGIGASGLDRTLRNWTPGLAEVRLVPYRFPRGPLRLLAGPLQRLPVLRDLAPSIVYLRWCASTGNPGDAQG